MGMKTEAEWVAVQKHLTRTHTHLSVGLQPGGGQLTNGARIPFTASSRGRNSRRVLFTAGRWKVL